MNGVLLPDAVEDVPDGGFERFERGVGFRPEPFVLNFAPERLDFVKVGAVGGRQKRYTSWACHASSRAWKAAAW